MYSAQLLGLIIATIVFHRIPTTRRGWLTQTLLLCSISVAHLQSSVILGIVLFIDGWTRTESATKSRYSAFILGSFFILWNYSVAEHSFSAQFSDRLYALFTPQLVFLLLILGTLSSQAYHSSRGIREGEIWGWGEGVSNISIVLGCILAIPLMFVADERIGSIRMVPRLLAFSLVPILFWGMKLIEYTMSKIEVRTSEKTYIFLAFSLSILAGSMAGFAHISYAERTLHVPDEMEGCWEMAEENGLVGLIQNNTMINNKVLHSHSMMSPATDRYFYRFVRVGDEFSLGNGSSIVSAVIETPDLAKGLERYNLTGIYSDWELIGEEPGACRFWVHPDFVKDLSSRNSWDVGAMFENSDSATRGN